MQQALRDVIDWVEHGQEPPADTVFDTTDDGAIVLRDDASERQGIQPVVRPTVNGAARADVQVGEPFRLEADISAPPGGGTIVAVEWDLDGSGAGTLAEHGIDGRSDVHVERARSTSLVPTSRRSGSPPIVTATRTRRSDDW